MKNRKGFTLIELMIVIAIIAIIAAIAIPNLLSSKKISNERTAPANLKAIHTAQTTFKEKLENDADSDQNGEYGYMDELEAARQINMAVAGVAAASTAEKNGYIFQIYLRSAQTSSGADENEEQWACAAWPKKWDKTGNKAFFINEEGSAYSHKNGTTAAAVGDGSGNAVALTEVYGTAWENGSIDAAWTTVK